MRKLRTPQNDYVGAWHWPQPYYAGVANALADPALELRDGNGALSPRIATEQDNSAQAAELTATGLAPASNLESAIAATLPPGLSTALLEGTKNSTGIEVIEVDDLGAP